MLDLRRLENTHLTTRPIVQILIAELFLRWQYTRRVDIVFEGYERVPRERPVFYALNHTDRYNYWPMQYRMYRQGDRFTATWVKGKYFESALMAAFMGNGNNIPVPSRGFVLTTEFRRVNRRLPNEDEYRWLRDALDGRPADEGNASAEVRAFVMDLTGAPSLELDGFRTAFTTRFDRMMGEVVRLNREALDVDCNVIVFPEGTRSARLGVGHTGLAQMTQHLGATIVPVGCNGSDLVYPGNSPIAKRGRIVYRFGAPLAPDGPELAAHRVSEAFTPFSDEATRRHGARFDAITGVVMDRINDLLDPRHRRGEGSAGEAGVGRFV